MERQNIDIKEVRQLAKRFTPEELESCIQQQMNEGTNVCKMSGPTEQVINELSKAGVVKELMNNGMPLSDAVRELARRIRLVQQGFEE